MQVKVRAEVVHDGMSSANACRHGRPVNARSPLQHAVSGPNCERLKVDMAVQTHPAKHGHQHQLLLPTHQLIRDGSLVAVALLQDGLHRPCLSNIPEEGLRTPSSRTVT